MSTSPMLNCRPDQTPLRILREKLTAHDFGSANFGLKDASFASHLAAADPLVLSCLVLTANPMSRSCMGLP